MKLLAWHGLGGLHFSKDLSLIFFIVSNSTLKCTLILHSSDNLNQNVLSPPCNLHSSTASVCRIGPVVSLSQGTASCFQARKLLFERRTPKRKVCQSQRCSMLKNLGRMSQAFPRTQIYFSTRMWPAP